MDEECDVLVIGDGIGGCTTAIAAQEQGARVIVIDKAPENVPHGNTAFSGGSFRRAGDQYPADQFYRDIVNLSGNRADPELTRIIVDGSAQAREWLAELGVEWELPYRTADRAHQSAQRGFGLAAALRHALKQRPIVVRNETEAREFVRDGQRIVGARVKAKDGRETIIRAGAVVLATGGFSANHEMVQHYIGPGACHLVLRGSPFNTGDGHRMAEAVGAKLDWMDDFHGGLIHYGYKKYPDANAGRGMRSVKKYEKCILVNQEGKRFVDEGESTSDKTYAKFGKIIALTQPDGVAYAIFDSNGADVIDPMYDGPERGPISAGTLDGLAGKLGIPRAALAQTVHDFNSNVADGKCLKCQPPKTNFAQKIDAPPFYAYKVTGGFTFTFGGVRTKKSGEVLDARAEPIAGLFAVGEIQTGIFYGNYAGGSSLARCAVFGRIVGRAAAEYAARVPAH
jgi:tricarballylate dehydrogenase